MGVVGWYVATGRAKYIKKEKNKGAPRRISGPLCSELEQKKN
jgi:hypothetical protein